MWGLQLSKSFSFLEETKLGRKDNIWFSIRSLHTFLWSIRLSDRTIWVTSGWVCQLSSTCSLCEAGESTVLHSLLDTQLLVKLCRHACEDLVRSGHHPVVAEAPWSMMLWLWLQAPLSWGRAICCCFAKVNVLLCNKADDCRIKVFVFPWCGELIFMPSKQAHFKCLKYKGAVYKCRNSWIIKHHVQATDFTLWLSSVCSKGLLFLMHDLQWRSFISDSWMFKWAWWFRPVFDFSSHPILACVSLLTCRQQCTGVRWQQGRVAACPLEAVLWQSARAAARACLMTTASRSILGRVNRHKPKPASASAYFSTWCFQECTMYICICVYIYVYILHVFIVVIF